jgi:predicted SAM-dependent methyltransferase
MKRLKDLFGREGRKHIAEAIGRRKSYYAAKYRRRGDRVKIDAYMASSSCRKLNLGCGDNVLEGWLNSDILDIGHDKIFVDAREAFPFPNNTFRFVYSEHLLEHLDYGDGLNFLKECHRVLQPGGVLRISTPDLGFLVDFYLNDTPENQAYLRWASQFYWQSSVCFKAFVVDRYFRSWGHRCIYDFGLMRDSCKAAEFAHVKVVQVGESEFPELKGIERHGDVISERWNIKESLVIEAVK